MKRNENMPALSFFQFCSWPWGVGIFYQRLPSTANAFTWGGSGRSMGLTAPLCTLDSSISFWHRGGVWMGILPEISIHSKVLTWSYSASRSRRKCWPVSKHFSGTCAFPNISLNRPQSVNNPSISKPDQRRFCRSTSRCLDLCFLQVSNDGSSVISLASQMRVFAHLQRLA